MNFFPGKFLGCWIFFFFENPKYPMDKWKCGGNPVSTSNLALSNWMMMVEAKKKGVLSSVSILWYGPTPFSFNQPNNRKNSEQPHSSFSLNKKKTQFFSLSRPFDQTILMFNDIDCWWWWWLDFFAILQYPTMLFSSNTSAIVTILIRKLEFAPPKKKKKKIFGHDCVFSRRLYQTYITNGKNCHYHQNVNE